MNIATPDDETTTAAGEGWSEDMELAPAHPGDRAARAADDDRQGERLQKVLARAGVGSRRVCEDMIEAGRISVNGAVVQVQGMRVDPSRDKIAVDGVRIEIRDDRVTYAMNKPPGVITAMSDDRNRPTVGDMVGDLAKGLVHVGRLDQDTEGLLLLTNDGELAHRLAHPSYEVRRRTSRRCRARCRATWAGGCGPASSWTTARSKVDSFRVVDTHAGQSVVEVVLHEGRKHIVRRLLAAGRAAGVAADAHRRRPDRAAAPCARARSASSPARSWAPSRSSSASERPAGTAAAERGEPRLDRAPAIRAPPIERGECMAVRAIRGATQVDADDREQVLEATRELVSAVLERNALDARRRDQHPVHRHPRPGVGVPGAGRPRARAWATSR